MKRLGLARLGRDWIELAGVARLGAVRQAWFGWAGYGVSWRGVARRDEEGRRGMACPGLARCVPIRLGVEWQARRGAVGLGLARRDENWQARLGAAGPGVDWRDEEGSHGADWQAGSGPVWNGQAC